MTESAISSVQRTCASAARPATRNGNELALRLPSGPGPLQALGSARCMRVVVVDELLTDDMVGMLT